MKKEEPKSARLYPTTFASFCWLYWKNIEIFNLFKNLNFNLNISWFYKLFFLNRKTLFFRSQHILSTPLPPPPPSAYPLHGLFLLYALYPPSFYIQGLKPGMTHHGIRTFRLVPGCTYHPTLHCTPPPPSLPLWSLAPQIARLPDCQTWGCQGRQGRS